MTLYSIALFVHVLGAVLLFAALTVEGIALRFSLAGLATVNRVIGPISAVAVLIPGLYMTAVTWGPRPWIIGGLAAWLLIAAVGTFTGIRMTRRERPVGSLVAGSWWARTGLALGVVFLMTVKPGALGSAIAIAVSAALGVAAAMPGWSRRRTAGEPA
jgi:hypothetical protein